MELLPILSNNGCPNSIFSIHAYIVNSEIVGCPTSEDTSLAKTLIYSDHVRIS